MANNDRITAMSCPCGYNTYDTERAYAHMQGGKCPVWPAFQGVSYREPYRTALRFRGRGFPGPRNHQGGLKAVLPSKTRVLTPYSDSVYRADPAHALARREAELLARWAV